jgi:hypothetical protein
MCHGAKHLRNGLAALVSLIAILPLAGFGGSGSFRGSQTYSDDFSNGHRWSQKRSAEADYGIVAKTFVISLKKAPWGVMARPIDMFGPSGTIINYADTRQAVDVGASAKTANMTMGLLCRWNGEIASVTAYAFHLSSRGEGPRWTIARFVAGHATVLAEGRGTFNIKKWNRLESTCSGTTLTFKVNGRQVARVQDSALKSGINGIVGVAVRQQKAPLVAVYDNYELSY